MTVDVPSPPSPTVGPTGPRKPATHVRAYEHLEEGAVQLLKAFDRGHRKISGDKALLSTSLQRRVYSSFLSASLFRGRHQVCQRAGERCDSALASPPPKWATTLSATTGPGPPAVHNTGSVPRPSSVRRARASSAHSPCSRTCDSYVRVANSRSRVRRGPILHRCVDRIHADRFFRLGTTAIAYGRSSACMSVHEHWRVIRQPAPPGHVRSPYSATQSCAAVGIDVDSRVATLPRISAPPTPGASFHVPRR